MIEVNAYKLENGLVYNQIAKIVYGKNIYVLLANENDVQDMCIRKLLKKDNDLYISKLDNDEEYDIVLSKFTEENKDLI